MTPTWTTTHAMTDDRDYDGDGVDANTDADDDMMLVMLMLVAGDEASDLALRANKDMPQGRCMVHGDGGGVTALLQDARHGKQSKKVLLIRMVA